MITDQIRSTVYLIDPRRQRGVLKVGQLASTCGEAACQIVWAYGVSPRGWVPVALMR
jgi:hypothetical protein